MQKHLFLILTVLFSIGMMAEDIPTGFYDAINGTQDSVLKSTLSLLVRGGERYEYGVTTYHSSSNPPEWEKGDLKAYGTWQALPLTDMHPDGIVWDMYSNCVRYYPNKPGDSGCSLNIEHCFPKSWWGGEVNDAYKDLYHLNPSDQRANSQKSNYAPGHVNKADKFDNGSFKMAKAANSSTGFICFEPEAQYRGDFARAYFYIATAYEDFVWKSGTSPFDAANALDNNSYLEFKPWLIEVLLDWHRADPVSDKECCRADRISDIQHNRNPFIDYPELVEYIWGNKKGQAVDLNALTCAFQTNVCPEPITPTPDPQKYDTLINLPAIAKNTAKNYTNGTIQGAEVDVQSNGTSSITMGSSNRDGEISFTGIQLTDTAVLAFRASPYNSAKSMQLDIYLNGSETPFRTISETVQQETRNEVRYRVTVPASTQTIRILSVGGKTDKRACMQELYLLAPKAEQGVCNTGEEKQIPHKEIHEGKIVIIRDNRSYSIFGQQIR